jgi:hypothetical protein
MVNILRILILAFGSAAVMADASLAQDIPAEKKADIEKLMEMTGALKLGQMMSTAIVGEFSKAIKAGRPNIPESALNAVTEEVNAVISENLPSFTEISVQIYDKHFTADEIRSLIAFYSSDLGKKVINVMPTITQESIKAGKDWGESLGPELQRRVRARLEKEGVPPKN